MEMRKMMYRRERGRATERWMKWMEVEGLEKGRRENQALQ
jgi:hypothetical protein